MRRTATTRARTAASGSGPSPTTAEPTIPDNASRAIRVASARDSAGADAATTRAKTASPSRNVPAWEPAAESATTPERPRLEVTRLTGGTLGHAAKPRAGCGVAGARYSTLAWRADFNAPVPHKRLPDI